MKVTVGYGATVEFVNKRGHRCVVPMWQVDGEWQCPDRYMEYWPDRRNKRDGEEMMIWSYLPEKFVIPRKWITQVERKLRKK